MLKLVEIDEEKRYREPFGCYCGTIFGGDEPLKDYGERGGKKERERERERERQRQRERESERDRDREKKKEEEKKKKKKERMR